MIEKYFTINHGRNIYKCVSVNQNDTVTLEHVCSLYLSYSEKNYSKGQTVTTLNTKSLNEINHLHYEGMTDVLDENFINFLIHKFGYSDSKMGKDKATGVAWNQRSYWYLKDCKKSTKPYFPIEVVYSMMGKSITSTNSEPLSNFLYNQELLL
jgi:hypothetical protein